MNLNLDRVEEIAGRKVAGVPIGVLGVLGGGSLLYYAVKMNKADPPAVADTGVPGGDQADTQDGYEGFQATGAPNYWGTGALVGPAGSAVSANVQDTNDAWVRRGVEWLIANGTSVSAASAALNKYVDGEPLSFQEGAIRDRAVAQFGLPPESAPISPVAPYKGPATKQGTPPLDHVVKGTSDSSFGALAMLYYGFSNAASRNLVEASNPGLGEPFRPGTAVKVPRFHEPKFWKATRSHTNLYEIASKNGTTPAVILSLNPGLKFPVKPGTRIRVK